MLYSTLLAATTAAVLTSASPIKARDTYSFSVSAFSYGCSPGGCAWSFNVSAPDNGATAPAFGPVYCSGTTYQTDYVDCGAISDTQSVGAWINGSSTPLELHVKYETEQPDVGSRFDWYGETGVQSTGHCPTCPTNYTVPVDVVTAVE